MTIRPQNSGHYKTADQARTAKAAADLVQELKDMAEAVRAADQKDGVDLNQDAGTVVLDQAKLKGIAGSQTGEASFGARGVESLSMSGPRQQLTFSRSHGFLGLGKEREVYTRYTSARIGLGVVVEQVQLDPQTQVMKHKVRVNSLDLY